MSGLKSFIFGAWLVTVSFLTSAPCFGEPFLVSDSYGKTDGQPTGFFIIAGKLKFSIPAEKLADGTVRLRFDLSKLPDGEHTIEVKAVNESRNTVSEPVSLKLVKKDGQVVIQTAPRGTPEKEKIPPSRTIPGLLRP